MCSLGIWVTVPFGGDFGSCRIMVPIKVGTFGGVFKMSLPPFMYGVPPRKGSQRLPEEF